MTGGRGRVGLGQGLPGALRLSEPLGFEPLQLLGDRGLDQDPQIAVGNRRAHQGLESLQLKAWAGDGAGGASSADLSQSPTLAHTGTAAGIILGNAAYMSPEQARGKPVDKRADIWAFGVVLWEALTGKRLFEGETASDVMAAVLKNGPDWGALPKNVGPATRRLLARCLEKNPGRRYRDIGDVAYDLDAGPAADVEHRGRRSERSGGREVARVLGSGRSRVVRGRCDRPLRGGGPPCPLRGTGARLGRDGQKRVERPTGLIVCDRAPDGRLLVSTYTFTNVLTALLPNAGSPGARTAGPCSSTARRRSPPVSSVSTSRPARGPSFESWHRWTASGPTRAVRERRRQCLRPEPLPSRAGSRPNRSNDRRQRSSTRGENARSSS